ncbi:glycosyltransferase [Halovulum dunhuangense]|uniref:Glycosyltransferase n=1 Tax=Halovulum dunhuangense TaxID=1505036 RepID=A0A849L249_9RHOB|nr:glycosyltransferase [Halovulum dunhuangense]NNU80297.1 glycosyltransferase [Halovulum dunhuangense]
MRDTLPARPNVAICVSTFRRPQGIRALLRSLDALIFDGPAPNVLLVIVDNDPAAPAFADAAELGRASRWPAVLVPEPARGIVAARNRALACVPEDADLVGFLDDDETVAPGWLAAMIATLRETGATVAQGPVVPHYAEAPPDWVEALGIFRLGPWPQGAALHFAATCNCVVRAGFLRMHGLRFDPAFNLSGGEDEEFFARLRDRGGRIVAAEGAVVHDWIPSARLGPDWALRRARRMGNTLGRIARLRRRGRALRVAKGIGAVGWGGLRMLAGLADPVLRMRGRLQLARGLGMLSAFADVVVLEYAPAAPALRPGSGR